MRTIFGILILVIGLVLLGLWGRSDHASDMEAMVAQNAQAALGQTTHETQIYVAGRDITVSGMADSEAERDQILATLNDVEGRRVVNDQLTLMTVANPFVFSGTKDGDTLQYSGNAPSEMGKAAFEPAIGDAAKSLNVAAGMPDDQWPTFVSQGVKSLGMLENGTLEITNRTLILKGDVSNPSIRGEIDTMLATLPEGYTSGVSLNVLDDGTPASLDLTYAEGLTTLITGKAPAGVDADMLSNMVGGATAYLKSSAQDGASRFGNVFDAIGQVLPKFTLASANVTNDAVTFKGKLKAGEDKASVMDTLSAAFGDGATVEIEETAVTVEEQPAVEEVVEDTATEEATPEETASQDDEPVAETDTNEVAGMAIPDISFLPSADRCKSTTNSVLENARVTFVTGSADLDAASNDVMDVLAKVLGRCINNTALAVEIGGHTDSQGDAFKNLILSKKRADAVRKALFDRGVNAAAMVAKGYGETQPIADNETAEGRAQNRRTTFTWSTN